MARSTAIDTRRHRTQELWPVGRPRQSTPREIFRVLFGAAGPESAIVSDLHISSYPPHATHRSPHTAVFVHTPHVITHQTFTTTNTHAPRQPPILAVYASALYVHARSEETV